MTSYKKRIADNILSRKLEGTGAVLIEGPKWCGKTTTAEQAAKSVLYMDKGDNVRIADLNINYILQGNTPRLIDEWQLAPQIWDVVRFEVDHREKHEGQFILTGSSVPADKSNIHHSGTGRFSWLTMHTMSLYESGDSTGEVSLKSLFDGVKDIEGESKHELKDIAYLICRGGWPATISMNETVSLDMARDYVDAVVESDISRVDGTERDKSLTRRLLRSYSRHQGTAATIGTIVNDLSGGQNTVSDKTIASYINALKQIFVIEDMPAWNPNLRSKSAIRTSDTRYFTDSSIAAAALRIGPGDLMKDLETFGLLFETLCVRDLRVFAEALDGDVFHFRDRNGLECDTIIHLRNGSYGLIEIKIGGNAGIEEGAKILNSLSNKIDTTRMPSPSFKMILTAVGRYAYKRKDGIFVVPIGCLKD